MLSSNAVNEFRRILSGEESNIPATPIVIGVAVFNSWLRNPLTRLSGKIVMPIPGEKNVGGHCMTILGFCDEPSWPGGGYFILRNSWGTGWAAENEYAAGYGLIPYAYVAAYCWEAWTGSLHTKTNYNGDIMAKYSSENDKDYCLITASKLERELKKITTISNPLEKSDRKVKKYSINKMERLKEQNTGGPIKFKYLLSEKKTLKEPVPKVVILFADITHKDLIKLNYLVDYIYQRLTTRKDVFYYLFLFSNSGWEKECLDNIPSGDNYLSALIEYNKDTWKIHRTDDDNWFELKDLKIDSIPEEMIKIKNKYEKKVPKYSHDERFVLSKIINDLKVSEETVLMFFEEMEKKYDGLIVVKDKFDTYLEKKDII